MAEYAAAISLEAVSKTFQRKNSDPVRAIDTVSFSVEDGEFVTVVGPSGCGKSTLLKIMAGLMPSSTGRVSLHGDPVTKPRRDVGIAFQSPILLPWRTVVDNVMLPITIYGLDVTAATRRTNQLIELVGLDGFEDRYPYELSGGMQQRVSLARALVHEPQTLFMDEPFGALDAMTRQIMNLELLRIWAVEKKTVVLITHDIQEAIFLADRVLVMSARPGCILEEIKVDLPRPRRLKIVTDQRFLAHVERIQALLGLDKLEELETANGGY